LIGLDERTNNRRETFAGRPFIKALIQNSFPHAAAPYRALEALMNRGFILLAAEMEANLSADRGSAQDRKRLRVKALKILAQVKPLHSGEP
jgi:hypothetical protein